MTTLYDHTELEGAAALKPLIAAGRRIADALTRCEAQRLETRERIGSDYPQQATYRAVCREPGCSWAWQSDSAVEAHDPHHATDAARAHCTDARHRVELVFDLVGVHLETLRPQEQRR